MPLKLVAVLIAIVGIAIVGWGVWYRQQHAREIVATGLMRVESRARPGAVQTLKTRTVRIGAIRLDEIELPNGTWIDCAGDCRRAAQDAGPDFWDAQARDRGR